MLGKNSFAYNSLHVVLGLLPKDLTTMSMQSVGALKEQSVCAWDTAGTIRRRIIHRRFKIIAHINSAEFATMQTTFLLSLTISERTKHNVANIIPKIGYDKLN